MIYTPASAISTLASGRSRRRLGPRRIRNVVYKLLNDNFIAGGCAYVDAHDTCLRLGRIKDYSIIIAPRGASAGDETTLVNIPERTLPRVR